MSTIEQRREERKKRQADLARAQVPELLRHLRAFQGLRISQLRDDIRSGSLSLRGATLAEVIAAAEYSGQLYTVDREPDGWRTLPRYAAGHFLCAV